MISLRHHVVSLVAVFLALAVGVVLGSGPLSGPGSRSGTGSGSSATDRVDDAAGSGAGADPSAATPYAERFAAEAGARLYADGLADTPVAVVAMPGADNDALKALASQVQAAGGRITGRYTVRGALLQPEQRSLVDTLGSQLVTQLADPRLDGSAPTYDRIGQLLGIAAATRDPAPVPADEAALAARDSLSGASLVVVPSVDVANAPLVLVVLGPEADLADGAADVQGDVVAGLTSTATGVVVLGDEASAAGGTLAVLRARTTPGVLATVDDGGSQLGQVGSVLALIGVRNGRGGAFGAAGADGAVPLA